MLTLPKKYVMDVKPIHTASMSVIPYSEEAMHLYSFETAFGDKVCGAVKNPSSLTLSIPRESVPYSDNDHRVSYPITAIDCNFNPRHEQQALCDKSIALLKAGINHIFESPTASGKTVMLSYVACQLGQPTLIIVNKQDLVDQWFDSLNQILGIPLNKIGRIQQDTCNWEGKQFVVGLIQSLIIPERYAPEMYSYFGMVIWDECHVASADCFVRSCQIFPAKYRVGCSATPTRKDGKTQLFNWHVGPTLVVGTVVAMQPKILIRETRWKIPHWRRKVGNGYEHVKIPYAPARMGSVYKAMSHSDIRNFEIVNFGTQVWKSGRRLLVMAELREHLDRLSQMFANEGIPTTDIGFYVGGMNKAELSITKTKRVALGSYAMCSTGTDCPSWDSLAMASPRSDIKQPIGRVLRAHAGKRQPVILDLVDDEKIFRNFAASRLKQYVSLNAEIVKV